MVEDIKTLEDLSPEELQSLRKVLQEKEKAKAFDWTDIAGSEQRRVMYHLARLGFDKNSIGFLVYGKYHATLTEKESLTIDKIMAYVKEKGKGIVAEEEG